MWLYQTEPTKRGASLPLNSHRRDNRWQHWQRRALDKESLPTSDDDALQGEQQRPNRSETTRSCLVDAILLPVAAGLLMHGPGLKVKLPFEDWSQFLESLLGAAVERARSC